MNESSSSKLLHKISQDFGVKLDRATKLSGGDINDVYLIESASGRYVVKVNNKKKFPGMFEAEKSGLETLQKPGIIDIPNPLKAGVHDDKTYLILEYKTSGEKSPNFWQIFGEQLALLHRQTSSNFGYHMANYIGSLPQYNDHRDIASDFYLDMRLQPQIDLARDQGFDLNISDQFFKNCENIIPNEPAALVHGDLWNGNYLVNEKGLPCLIDPAVAFAPREMDLALMRLFGGFSENLFKVYDEIYPLERGWEHRVELWQLYYLLVHLNIFGAGYKSQVSSIVAKYS